MASLNYMNLFGKRSNSDDCNEFTIIPELVPVITTEKWYEKSYVKIILAIVLITGISVGSWILLK